MAHLSIAAASSGNSNSHNTESLRVEELIPEQLRASSENFVKLITDYYEHLNTIDFPTYETNRITAEHDIDQVSGKYLDGIQGEIAKNIPNSAVMNRVELYKKIVKFYTLKGSHESVSTFFRLFFDEIIQVIYPKEYLFKLSDGDWRQNTDKYIKKVTGSLSSGYKIDQLNYTPFILKNNLPDPAITFTDLTEENSNDATLPEEVISNIIATGKIIEAKPIDLYNRAPNINGLSVDLYIENDFNSVNGTWDSTVLDRTWRGYLKTGAEYLRAESAIRFNGQRAHLDFGAITDRELDLTPDEHTIVVRAKRNRSAVEKESFQPLFNLSNSFSKLASHELLFDSKTGQIGRSWINTEPNIALNIDGESLELINFLDDNTSKLEELTGDAYTEINKFMTVEDRFGNSKSITALNGVWNKTAAIFNGEPVYVPTTSLANNISGSELDQVPTTGTAWPDFRFADGLIQSPVDASTKIQSVSYSTDGSVVALSYNKKTLIFELSGSTWTQIGADIITEYNSNNEIITGKTSTCLNSDGTIVAIGNALNDDAATNAGHVRVYQNVSGTWTQIGVDIDGDPSQSNSYFGYSVSLNADGSIVAIGAYDNDGGGATSTNRGHVRVYKNISGTWTQIGVDIDGTSINEYTGWRVSLSADGSIVALVGIGQGDINSPDSAFARVYKNVSGTWTQLGSDIHCLDQTSAWAAEISLSADGNTFVLGNREPGGEIRIFRYGGGTWQQLGKNIIAPVDSQVVSTVLSDDASKLVIQTSYDYQMIIGDTQPPEPAQITAYEYNDSPRSRRWEIVSQFTQDLDVTPAFDVSGDGRNIISILDKTPVIYTDQYASENFADFQKVLFFEESPLNPAEGRWVINLDGSRLYHTEYTDIANRSRPWDLTTRWFKNVEGTEGNLEFTISTESTTNLAHRYTNKTVKKEGDYLFRLKNYGLLSVYIKRNGGEYDPLQSISLGDTAEYDGSRIYEIADYDVEGDCLTILDTCLAKPRVVVFKKTTTDRYIFDHTFNLQLLNFGSIELRGSRIIVATLPIGDDHDNQVINIYDTDESMVWSETEYTNIGQSVEVPAPDNLEIEYDFRNNPSVLPVEYPISEDVSFSNSSARSVTVQFKASEDYKLGGKLFEIGSGLDKFTIALGWNHDVVFSTDRYPWIFLGDNVYPETNTTFTKPKSINFVPGKVHTFTATITGNHRDIKEDSTGDVTPNHLLEMSITFDGELLGTGILVKSSLSQSLELKRTADTDYADKKDQVANAFVGGGNISIGDDDLNAEILYVSAYSKYITNTESYVLHKYIESSTNNTGVNTKLDHGNFAVNQLGNIIAKVAAVGIHIWEKTKNGWEYKFNSNSDIDIDAIKRADTIIPRLISENNIPYYSYEFFGNLLLVADGGDYDDYTGVVHAVSELAGVSRISSNGAFTTDTNKTDPQRVYSLETRYEINQRIWRVRSTISAIGTTQVASMATSGVSGAPTLGAGDYQIAIAPPISPAALGAYESTAQVCLDFPDSCLEFSVDTAGVITITKNVNLLTKDITPTVYVESINSDPEADPFYVMVNLNWEKDVGRYATDIATDTQNGTIAISKTSDTNVKYDIFDYTFGVWTNTSIFGDNIEYDARYPFHAAIDKYDIFLSTTRNNNVLDFYRYDVLNNKVWEKQQEIYNDFVATTVQGLIFHDSETEVIEKSGKYTNIIIRGTADRYNGNIEVSVNGGEFTTIILGNTAYALNVPTDSRLTVGRLDANTGETADDHYFKGDITHVQYYNKSVTDNQKDNIIEYLEKSPLNFYEITLTDLEGDVTDAAKLTNVIGRRDESFVFENLEGHAINSFWTYDETKTLSYDEDEALYTNANVQAKYDSTVSHLQNIYWGDGRSSSIISNQRVSHTYTSEYLGEYKDRKGRVSSVNRVHDGVYWQEYSYAIKSSIRIEDWEKQYLSLVHPAGLRFFASVLLLVIRDNHWHGPSKRVKYDDVLRKNLSLIKVEDNFLSPFRTRQPVNDLRWLESLVAPNETGGYHLPLFQPGWLQGDVRVREFIFAAAEWTKIARIVPGNQRNQSVTTYTNSYFANNPKTDSAISIVEYSGVGLKLNDIIYQNIDNNILRGIIVKIDADGNGGIARLDGIQKKINNVPESDRAYSASVLEETPTSLLDAKVGLSTKDGDYIDIDLNPEGLDINPDVYGIITQGGIVSGSESTFDQIGSDIDGIYGGLTRYELNRDGTVLITGVRNTGATGLVRVWQWREWSAQDVLADYNYSATRPLSGTLPIIVTGSAQDIPGLGVAPVAGTYYWTQLGLDIVGDPIGTNGGSSSQAWVTAGSGVAISDDGMTIAVGASGDSNAGLLYNGSSKVYDYDTLTKNWVQRGETIWGIQNHSYSGPMTVSADGNRLVVGFGNENANGKRDAGVIRTYDWDTTGVQWVESVGRLTGSHSWEYFGDSATLSADGDTLSVRSWGDDDRPTSDQPWGPRDGSDGVNFKERRGSVSVYKYYEHPEGTYTNPEEDARDYSGYYQTNSDFKQSKLDSPQAWSPPSSNLASSPYIQIDLGAMRNVSGIVSQPRADLNQWVTRFRVEISVATNPQDPEFDDTFIDVGDEFDSISNDIIWSRDRHNKTETLFDANVLCKYIRIYPLLYKGFPSMRVGLILPEGVKSWAQIGQRIYGEFDGDHLFGEISRDGSRLYTAAFSRYQDKNTDNINGTNRVYEYNGTNWIQVGNTFNGGEGERLLISSISEDGSRIAIGDNLHDESGADNIGICKVYDWDLIDGWVEISSATGENAGDQSWRGVLSGNGSRLMLGSGYNNDAGAQSHSKAGSVKVYEQLAITGFTESVEFKTSNNGVDWTAVDGGNNYTTGNDNTNTKSFIEFSDEVLEATPLVDKPRYLRVYPKTGEVDGNANGVEYDIDFAWTSTGPTYNINTLAIAEGFSNLPNNTYKHNFDVNGVNQTLIFESDGGVLTITQNIEVDETYKDSTTPRFTINIGMVLRLGVLTKSDLVKFNSGDIYALDNNNPTGPHQTDASIRTFPIKREEHVMELYDSLNSGAAYIDDQVTIDANAEQFIRTILTTFKYVIPTFQPRHLFAKHDYQQNLKFKDWNDISSYLNLTIADAISDESIFTNLGARMRKRNPLESEDGQIFTLEKHVVGSDANNNILIDDIAEWWNDPENPNDVSAPVQATITAGAGTINPGDTVYQDVQDEEGDNITIGGLIVDKPDETTLMIAWKSAVNTTEDPAVTLPSMPEYDILFRVGDIYTLDDTPKTATITIIADA